MTRNPILLLLSSIGVIGANSLLLSPIALSVGKTFQVTGEQVMMAAAAYGLGVAISALLLAPRGDRIGADRAVAHALALLSVALFVSALAPFLIILIVAQVLAGIAAGMALPAIYTLSAEISTPGREAQTIGIVLTGWTLSMVLGVSASALITDHYGWRVVYLILAAFSLLLLLPLRKLIGISNPSQNITSPLTALRVPGIWGGLTGTFLLMFAFYISYFFTGLHIEGTLGLSATASGAIPLVYGLGFGVSVLFDKSLDRIGLVKSLPLIFGVIAMTYLAMAFTTQSYVAFVALSFVWGLGQHMGLNMTVARLTRLDPTQRGAVMGLYSTVTYFCVFVAPLVGGMVFAFWGLLGCLIVAAFCAAIEMIETRLSLKTGPACAPRP